LATHFTGFHNPWSGARFSGDARAKMPDWKVLPNRFSIRVLGSFHGSNSSVSSKELAKLK
jgi:hypothetical protein